MNNVIKCRGLLKFITQLNCKSCNAPIKCLSTLISQRSQFLPRTLGPSLEQHRFKSKKNKRQELQSEDEEESGSEKEDYDSVLIDKYTKVITIKVNSLRCDVVLKTGLYMARNKVEELFYESKIRVNGKKIFKKSDLIKEGDEIDIVKGFDSKNPKFLNVGRVEVLSVAPKGEGYGLRIRQSKSLTIENYEEPYKAGDV